MSNASKRFDVVSRWRPVTNVSNYKRVVRLGSPGYKGVMTTWKLPIGCLQSIER